MKVLIGSALALALAMVGCQGRPAAQQQGGGGGGAGSVVRNIHPSPAAGLAEARLLSGATGGVRKWGGPPMGAMDPSGIGPGNIEPGGGGGGGEPLGSPKRYPPPQSIDQEDPYVTPAEPSFKQ